MGRRTDVPHELKVKPITLADARRCGLTRWQLEGKGWRRVARGIYVWDEAEDSPLTEIAAAKLRLPQEAVFSGRTAAWLFGLEPESSQLIEVTLPADSRISRRSRISVRRAALSIHDMTTVRGIRTTTIERTLADLSSQLSIAEAVVLADSALRKKLTSIKKVDQAAITSGGRPGVAAFRRLIGLCEPLSESPMESRLRMVVVLAGLPRPVAQYRVHDLQGRFLGRPDLYYPEAKLGLEYDGTVHRTSLEEDNRRQNRLLEAGVTLLRFTASDIYQHPDLVVAQVRAMLTRAA